MHILISGGGIGGLTAAIALRYHGIEATVLEQAREMKEIGAGVQIAANASIVLRELGIEDAVCQAGVIPGSYDYRDLHTGRMLYAAPLGDDAAERYGAPLYNIHRADLIDILKKALPADAIRLNSRVESYSQSDSGVEACLSSGETITGDALIACDGIHSVIRQKFLGEEPKHFAGFLMWRSLLTAEEVEGLGLEENGNYWFGPGRTLITYWVRSKNLYSILASVPANEVLRESWTESGDIEELRNSFAGIEPRAQRMMDQIKTGFITGMYYRDPITNWSQGRVSLLGDAAHPMVPFLAAGAGQAIEDAWTLARVLDRRRNDIPGALIEYQERRIPRTTRIQAGARAVVKLMHESDPARIRDRNNRWKGMTRIDPLAETSWGLAWKYDVLKAVDAPVGEVLGLTGLREGKQLFRPEAQRAFDFWKRAFTQEDVARGHDGLREAYDRFLMTSFPVPDDAIVETTELGMTPVYKVQGADASSDTVILHFHGGGYLIGSAKASVEYAYRLAKSVRGTCYTVDYRLAPEHAYPAALDDAVEAYRRLVASGVPASSIILSGESSGGGLALALALMLKMAGDDLPAGIIAICPFADLTLSGQSIIDFNGDDPAANRDTLTFMAASYFQGHEPRDPLVSPLFGDLSGLPPLYITATNGEILVSDAIRLADRAKAAGLDTTFRLIDDSVHVFPIFPFLPEAEAALDEVASLVDRWRKKSGDGRCQAA